MTDQDGAVTTGDGQADGNEAPASTAPAPAPARHDTNPGNTARNSPPSAEAAAAGDEEAAVQLLGREKFDQVKNDPKALAKALHQSYTQKTQALASHRSFLEAWQENPTAVIENMAKQYGLEVTKRQKDAVADTVRTKLAETFGEEAADALTSTISQLVEGIVEAKQAPFVESVEEITQEAALQKVESIFTQMDTKHPGWRELEAKMEEIGKTLIPNGIDDLAYMELLYNQAKASAAVAEGVEAAVTRINASAKAGERPAPVNPGRIASAPPGNGQPSFDDAWKAAKAGIVWDPEQIRAQKRAARK